MRTGARRTHRDAALGERGTHRLVAWVAAPALLSWEKAWLVPYAHGIRYYVALQPDAKPQVDLGLLQQAALATTLASVVPGSIVFVTRPVKG